MGFLLCKVYALDLCTTPTFQGKFYMPVNLPETNTALCATLTDLWLYLLVIEGICIAMYLQYIKSTNSNACLDYCCFNDQVAIWVTGSSRSAVVTQFQCWLAYQGLNRESQKPSPRHRLSDDLVHHQSLSQKWDYHQWHYQCCADCLL